ncbi:MAG: hypothetical protein EPO45_19180 [Sphingobium sp.]|nr:MAG: hypothetical protein EPO45_19180 [Sphingobium sp.]
MIFFSPSHRSFFSDEARAPADAVAITDAVHRRLLDGQANGGSIVAGPGGHPRLARAEKMTVAERRLLARQQVKRIAARRIEAISPIWRQLNDLRSDSPAAAARFAAIDTIRTASSRIEAELARATSAALDEIDLAGHPAWPAIEDQQ